MASEQTQQTSEVDVKADRERQRHYYHIGTKVKGKKKSETILTNEERIKVFSEFWQTKIEGTPSTSLIHSKKDIILYLLTCRLCVIVPENIKEATKEELETCLKQSEEIIQHMITTLKLPVTFEDIDQYLKPRPSAKLAHLRLLLYRKTSTPSCSQSIEKVGISTQPTKPTKKRLTPVVRTAKRQRNEHQQQLPTPFLLHPSPNEKSSKRKQWYVNDIQFSTAVKFSHGGKQYSIQ
jgi:hypothetical protein